MGSRSILCEVAAMSDNGTRPRISIVIPNWNGKRLLEEISIPALETQTFHEFETIVVDNGSSDGSTDYLASSWPEIRVVALDRNIGFAGAVNRGVEASQGE